MRGVFYTTVTFQSTSPRTIQLLEKVGLFHIASPVVVPFFLRSSCFTSFFVFFFFLHGFSFLVSFFIVFFLLFARVGPSPPERSELRAKKTGARTGLPHCQFGNWVAEKRLFAVAITMTYFTVSIIYLISHHDHCHGQLM